MNNEKYQYSLLDALPEKSAYLTKQVFIASAKFISCNSSLTHRYHEHSQFFCWRYLWELSRTPKEKQNNKKYVSKFSHLLFRFYKNDIFLRHDFCSRLIQAGEELSVVSELAGHSSIITTQR